MTTADAPRTRRERTAAMPPHRGRTFALGLFLAYNAIIFGAWAAVGADYRRLLARDVIVTNVVAPLALGALLIVAALSWARWWRPVLLETRGARPRWAVWPVLAAMLALITMLLADIDWRRVPPDHLALIAFAALLVGFNEEAPTRGALVVGLRRGALSETSVCLLSSALFGLMHLPNGFFGTGLAGGAAQAAMAFLAGCGFYLTRRVAGTVIAPEVDIHRLLNRTAGREVLLSIRPATGGDPVLETVRPVSLLDENRLAYRRWVDQRRALVTRLSGGRLGYVHVRLMNLAAYQAAYGEVFGRHADAEGLIVDIRANGGGNLHDQLIAMLTGESLSATVSRDGDLVYANPKGRWTKPSAVLGDAQSYSDGSVFPTLYKARGIGPLIGAPIPGTGTAVVHPPLIDRRLVYGIPEMGFRLNDGRFFENLEVQPDVLVLNDPESVAAGRDPQLEAAVETLLKRLDGVAR